MIDSDDEDWMRAALFAAARARGASAKVSATKRDTARCTAGAKRVGTCWSR
jgi:hypothetical protein